MTVFKIFALAIFELYCAFICTVCFVVSIALVFKSDTSQALLGAELVLLPTLILHGYMAIGAFNLFYRTR